MLNASVPLEQIVKSLEKTMPTLGTVFRQTVQAGLKAEKPLAEVLDECFAAIVAPGMAIWSLEHLKTLNEKWAA
jgi:hypothetical protein